MTRCNCYEGAMKIEMPWGNEKLSIEVPDTWHLHFPERQSNTRPTPVSKFFHIIMQELKKPARDSTLKSSS